MCARLCVGFPGGSACCKTAILFFLSICGTFSTLPGVVCTEYMNSGDVGLVLYTLSK